MKKGTLVLAVLLILVITAIVIMALMTADKNRTEDRFSVTGSGIVYAKADIANIQVGFKTETKKTAAEATTDSTIKMNNIIQALTKLNIDEKDIQTTNYSLEPVYNWTDKTGQTLAGYDVSQTLTVKVRDLAKIGDVIARTTEQGANQIGDINFTIDDEYSLKNQAEALAITKAEAKAQLVAQEAGLKLGRVKDVEENSASSVPSPMVYSPVKSMVTNGGAVSLASPVIQSGQNQIKVDVTVVYEVE